jgi:aldehyde:ferredoxin oxidoreductase
MGILPMKNFQTGDMEGIENLFTEAYARMRKGSHGCFNCMTRCGQVHEVTEGPYSGSISEGPEYETMAGYGSLIDNKDLKEIIKANYLCNDYGIDTISSSGVIALLMDLIDRKIITANDIDGIDLKWGDMANVYKLIELISLRKGIGNLLAEGSNAVGKKFKVDFDQIATVMNNEIPYHDARSSFGMGIAYAISPTYGASHCLCDMYMTSLGQAWDELEINSVPAQENSKEMAIASARLQEYRAFGSSVISCVFGNPQSTSSFAKLVEYSIGIPFDLQSVKEYGRRILNLKRLANLKFGLTPAHEKLPKILLTPLPGGTNGNVPDMDLLSSEFYKYEQWDPVTGMPSKEIIEKYGLTNYAKF